MISPKVSYYLNLAVCVLAIIVAGGPKMFPGYVPDALATSIVQTCAFVVAIAAGVNSYLHGVSSAAAGPFAAASAANAAKPGALILAALLLMPAPVARAQTLPGPVSAFLTGDFQGAIDLAAKATPPDTVGAACFGALQTAAKNLGGALPVTLHVATDFERLWLFHLQIVAFKADPNCQAVCARLGQIAPLLSKAPTICDAVNLLR